MHQPRVSVIIPVYNAENYLDRCIESAVKQTYTNIEIILVDDGSADKSGAICDSWAKKDSRIRVIHKSNEGAGLARNTGLDIADGEYVLFIDSDDFIHPETVKSCVSAAEKDNSEIVLYGRADVRGDGSIKEKTILTDKYLYKDSDVTEDLFASLCIRSKGFGFGVVGKMMKLSTIKENKIKFYSEREFLSEDALFLTEFFAYIRSATIVPEYYYMCVIHDDSLSNAVKESFQKKNNEFLKKAVDICESKCYSENIINHLKARYLSYSLAGIKQIVASDSTLRQKIFNIKKLLGDQTLCSVLVPEVMNVLPFKSRFFWMLFKARCVLFCYIIIKIKM